MTIRQNLINLLLLAAFIVAIIAVTWPLAAQTRFNAAQRLFWRWEAADQAYRDALFLAPRSAEYHLAYGDFLWERAYETETALDHKLVETTYQKAVELNPACAECWVKLGRIQLTNNQTNSAIIHFYKALEVDPRGSDTAFRIREAAASLLQSNFQYLSVYIDLTKDFAYTPAGTYMITDIFNSAQRNGSDTQLFKRYQTKLNQRSQATGN
ncbi:MAG: hypothetical protein K8I82_11755 [Anaerolineae bacterium]|nr:hypothetical protein [Anaerolineae bacterium]